MTKEELKQEAEKYVKQNYCEMCVMADDCKCGCIDCFTVQAYLASAEPREKRIAELEKENAELKKQLEMSNKVYNDNLDYSHHIEEQLTKAKDHIKKLLDCLEQDTNDPQTNYYVCQYMDKAEQFISEVEK